VEYVAEQFDPLWTEEERPENLRSRTKRFALAILDLLDELPLRQRFQTISRQLSRSATSVGANYREASRARSDAEFVAKIGDCLKELDESAWWLELLIASPATPEPLQLDATSQLTETHQLIAIFTVIAKKVRSRLK
jgi:four helix bundle protein